MQMRRYACMGTLFFVAVCCMFPNTTLGGEIDTRGIFAHTNMERYRAHVPLLSSNEILNRVAYRKMVDMFTRQYFAHESPSGEDVSYLAESAGYEYLSVGENLALGTFASSGEIVRAWMNSPGHKKNILNQKYAEIGIAVGRNIYKGRSMWIAVQAFGLPKNSCPEVHSGLRDEIDTISFKLTLLEKLLAIREASAKESGIRQSVYTKRVQAYNTTVALYNALVGDHRDLIKKYNEEVRLFNECIDVKAS